MSFIEVDREKFISICDEFITKRNGKRRIAKENGKLPDCRPDRAVTLRNMALSADKFMLGMKDYNYLNREISIKKLHTMRS